ncbi:hypothetical protein GCM10010358_73450 [Streptomyces minutiscleroticus]|uniref:Mutator family transposase n=1 Tax=Streptomyces minutiscleroticus TaxID=68238 RepID=A0A918NZY7_9ACTN|nr:hypothetical protein GCM10010358_73450 [Streptomyces minutiscleroticus]
MTDTVVEPEPAEQPVQAPSSTATDEQLIAMLVDRVRNEGLQLTGEGGLLQMLAKRVLESALEGEITDHVGYEKHDPAGKNNGNSRNGTRAKTVLTDVGPVEVRVPRDTAGTFEPQIVKKRQRRLTGVDEMVLSLSAKGPTHGEISAHLAEVYGAEVSKQTHLHHYRQGDGRHGRMAEPSPRPRLPGPVRGRHQRQDQGSVDDLVIWTVEQAVPTVCDHASGALVMCSWSCFRTCPRC